VKKIVIPVAVVIMLIGIGVSAMKTLGIGPFAPEDEAAAQAAAAPPAEPPHFIEMDPILVPLFAGDRVAATVQLLVTLETLTAANETAARAKLPRISDAFLRDLHAYLPQAICNGRPLDVPLVKQRLRTIADRTVGAGIVNDVLVQSMTDASRAPQQAPAN